MVYLSQNNLLGVEIILSHWRIQLSPPEMPVPGTPGNRKSPSYLTLRYLKLSARLWKVNIFSWNLEEWFRKKIWIDRCITCMDHFSDKTQEIVWKECGKKFRRVRYHRNGEGRVRYHMDTFKYILIISFYLWFYLKNVYTPVDINVFDKYVHHYDDID